MTETPPLRIGILGAARIAPLALIRPARHVPEVSIAAIAARDQNKARAFATKHGIPRVHDSYDAVLADPEIDAIYNPLPNSLHCVWTIKALEAGKHVLCEKPLASNMAEAERMADAAAHTGRILIEAFHYRYHPLARRLKEIVSGGELGRVQHIETNFCVPIPSGKDIRFRFDLAGGATMDTGCYTISLIRYLAGAEPEVLSAEAKLFAPDVDRYMTAELYFPQGMSGRITCALRSAVLLRASAQVQGDRGQLRVFNPYAPQFGHWLRVRTDTGSRIERVVGESTYTNQLRAFVATVRAGVPSPTGPTEAIANMKVIDAVYRAAGMRIRGDG